MARVQIGKDPVAGRVIRVDILARHGAALDVFMPWPVQEDGPGAHRPSPMRFVLYGPGG